jgi:hypothetical protein
LNRKGAPIAAAKPGPEGGVEAVAEFGILESDDEIPAASASRSKRRRDRDEWRVTRPATFIGMFFVCLSTFILCALILILSPHYPTFYFWTDTYLNMYQWNILLIHI